MSQSQSREWPNDYSDIDLGTSWHPKWLKPGDLLPDLSDEEVEEHRRKPEADEQPDGHRLLEGP